MNRGAVPERLHGRHLLSCVAIELAAAALVVACFRPVAGNRDEALVGAGDEQRGFRYEREPRLALDCGWPGPPAAVGAFALMAAAVTAIVIGSRRWIVVASFLIAVALGALVFDMKINGSRGQARAT